MRNVKKFCENVRVFIGNYLKRNTFLNHFNTVTVLFSFYPLSAGKGFSPKFRAAQMCTFFRYLPIMLSSYTDERKKCWKFF